MPWTSFWCGMTTWSEDVNFEPIDRLHHHNLELHGKNLTTTTTTNIANASDSIAYTTTPINHFHMDLILMTLLAILSLVANLGLLYLARLTKPAAQMPHSSFSMTGPMSPFTVPPQGANQTGSPRGRFGIFRLLRCCRPAAPSPTAAFYSALVQNSSSTIALRKCSSSVSISRMASNSITGPLCISTGNSRAPRTRRHRRYLKGLLGLSVSNLTVAFSLFVWCALHITEAYVLIPWLAVLSVANTALADVAQTLEIGAVLWIALERTLGIHWPRERRPSSPGTGEKSQAKRTVFDRLHDYNPTWCCVKKCRRPDRSGLPLTQSFNHRTTKTNQTMTLDEDRFMLTSCFNCFHTDCPVSSCLPGSNNLALKLRLLKNLRCATRIVLSLFPLIVFLLAAVHSFYGLIQRICNTRSDGVTTLFFLTERMLWKLHENQSVNQRLPDTVPVIRVTNGTRFFTISYYTNSIVAALVIGQFIAPLTILITTNLLIYRKVAARDKQFFSRQSSNTSKSSFISTTSNFLGVAPNTPQRKTVAGCPINTIPLLRVVESSNQDLSTCEAPPAEAVVGCDLPKSEHHLLVVPDLGPELLKSGSELELSKCKLAQRRSSTPLLPVLNDTKPFESVQTKEMNGQKHSFATPQMRRKSSNDVFASLFHGRNSEPSVSGRGGEEPLLVQMLRRQHRRTLRILIILLLVFVVCRAPRALILMIGWLQSSYLCTNSQQAYMWLQYMNMWAHTSAVLDTIVYGFWGNRAYRTRLRQWYSKCINYSKHEH